MMGKYYCSSATVVHDELLLCSTTVFINRGWVPMNVRTKQVSESVAVDRPQDEVSLVCAVAGEEKVLNHLDIRHRLTLRARQGCSPLSMMFAGGRSSGLKAALSSPRLPPLPPLLLLLLPLPLRWGAKQLF